MTFPPRSRRGPPNDPERLRLHALYLLDADCATRIHGALVLYHQDTICASCATKPVTAVAHLLLPDDYRLLRRDPLHGRPPGILMPLCAACAARATGRRAS